MPHIEIIFFFFIISIIYASVGFGGGSSYLAILALYAMPFKEIRLIALICNIVVVTGGSIIFIRKKEVSWKKTIPLIIASVPMAFVGAAIKINQQFFFIVLGCSLLAASILLWLQTSIRFKEEQLQPMPAKKNIVIGAGIGFLSGLAGIGGGIFLSPVLHLSHWGTARQIAATASIFILANSVAGIVGQLTQMPWQINYKLVLFLSIAVFIGGQVGSRLAVLKFDHTIIKRLTAVLVFVAAVEVLTKHLAWFK